MTKYGALGCNESFHKRYTLPPRRKFLPFRRGRVVEKFVSDNSKCIYNRTSEGEGGMDLFWNDFMG
jgi:hypothetical protein